MREAFDRYAAYVQQCFENPGSEMKFLLDPAALHDATVVGLHYELDCLRVSYSLLDEDARIMQVEYRQLGSIETVSLAGPESTAGACPFGHIGYTELHKTADALAHHILFDSGTELVIQFEACRVWPKRLAGAD